MNVSIIYVNYKTGQLIANSIDTVIQKTEGVIYEIIVVDNASFDGSVEFLKERHKNVIFVESPENLGFGRANNLGIDIAKGEFVFFLNPDTLLINNAIKILSDFLKTHDCVGACGGNLYDENMNPGNSFTRRLSSATKELLSVFYISIPNFSHPRSSYFNFTGKPLKVASILGADLMIKKSVIEQVGGFDSDFFMYGEESELCNRISKKGYQIISVPTAEIIHLEGRAFEVSKFRSQLIIESQFITYKKKYGKNGDRLLYRILLFKYFLRIYLFSILYNKKKIKYWKEKRNCLGAVWQKFKE
ncbi:MAG: glycosyltransferase family 2 protein [Dysgonamonadaceae bacterium]|jgi:GT2 family glycosyltransferase|nr:glycosyltransferase family 2 protein [Dysgonamonadaceae bacterium]